MLALVCVNPTALLDLFLFKIVTQRTETTVSLFIGVSCFSVVGNAAACIAGCSVAVVLLYLHKVQLFQTPFL